jgi:hypothetical protein
VDVIVKSHSIICYMPDQITSNLKISTDEFNVQKCIYETTNTEIGVMNITEYICLPFGRAPMPFNQYSLQVDLYIIGPYVATKTKRGPPWS